MASMFSHIAIPIASRIGLGKNLVPTRLLLLACIYSILPDLDVIAFSFGIPYESPFGHRGFTHSFAFAVCMAALCVPFHRYLKASKWAVFGVLMVAMLSHSLLDALTNGGLGVAFFWPLTNERFFSPWQPIQVSPIVVWQFFSEWGIAVINSEVRWIWMPVLGISLFCSIIRHIASVKCQ